MSAATMTTAAGVLPGYGVDSADRMKAFALLRAARAGVAVFETASGGYAVGQQAQEVPDLRALQRVLTQMGAA